MKLHTIDNNPVLEALDKLNKNLESLTLTPVRKMDLRLNIIA